MSFGRELWIFLGVALSCAALALAITPIAAQTITPQIGGGISFTFDGGISASRTVTPPPSCVSPTAPNGQVDLSQCSNAFYVAVILF